MQFHMKHLGDISHVGTSVRGEMTQDETLTPVR